MEQEQTAQGNQTASQPLECCVWQVVVVVIVVVGTACVIVMMTDCGRDDVQEMLVTTTATTATRCQKADNREMMINALHVMRTGLYIKLKLHGDSHVIVIGSLPFILFCVVCQQRSTPFEHPLHPVKLSSQ